MTFDYKKELETVLASIGPYGLVPMRPAFDIIKTYGKPALSNEELEVDVIRTAISVAALIDKTTVAQHEFDALVSLAYDIGLKRFEESGVLSRHRKGDRRGAARVLRQMQPLPRRLAEAALYKAA